MFRSVIIKTILLFLGLCFLCPAAVFAGETAQAPGDVPVVSAEEFESLVAACRGKPLVLVYWASWCVPCRQYKEKLSALRAAYPEAELQMLGLSLDTDKAALKRFMQKNTLPFKTVAASEEFYESIAGTPVPTTILYNSSGEEVRRIIGNTDERRLRHYVKKLF